MTINIAAVESSRPDLAGQVTGFDLQRPLDAGAIAAARR